MTERVVPNRQYLKKGSSAFDGVMSANDGIDLPTFSTPKRVSEISGEVPSAISLRSAGMRLLSYGYHSEAELLFRAALVPKSKKPDLVAKTLEDVARAVLPRLPLQSLELLNYTERMYPECRDTMSILNLKGRISYELADLNNSEKYYIQANQMAERSKDDAYRGYTLANLSSVAFEQGNIKRSFLNNRRSVDILLEKGKKVEAFIVLCNMATYSLIEGEQNGVVSIIDTIEDEVENVQNTWLLAWYEFIRGEAALMLESDVEAYEHFSRALGHASTTANSTIQAKALTWKSVLNGDQKGESLLHDLADVARDLYARGLRADSASVFLIAARFAEMRKLNSEARTGTAYQILGDTHYTGVLENHYKRLFRIISKRRPRSKVQPLPEYITLHPDSLHLKERLARLAKTDVRLLIEGASGTGKSFLAGLIHKKGRGEKRPFIVVDCTNLEENLFESKLFGHMRGSFTGAISNTVGLVEQADGGTLFLDEIGELPVEIQAKLLYTIEEQRFRPVGAKAEKTSDFRVIAATNRDIDEMLADGTLRRDLYFRIAGYRVRLPSLEERREDIVPLAELQLKRLNERYGRKKTLRPDGWEVLVRYGWPGNVRELNAALERGFHLSQGRRIGIEDLGLDASPGGREIEDLSWETVRREHLLRVLRLCRANVTQAAKMLGMNRTTLIYKLKQLGIERSDFDPSYQESTGTDDEAADVPSLRLVADRETETLSDDGPDGAE